MANIRPPKIPKLLDTKIYKTGQTRGADDDVIFQNRVSRSSTVLIPYSLWSDIKRLPEGVESFESGFICLLTPEEYFETENIDEILTTEGLSLGINTLVFYQKRVDWEKYNPERLGWNEANHRTAPLLGNYVARIAATTATAENGVKISRGFNTTGMKGAGIRLFEYASKKSILECRIQLEAIFWLCQDSLESTCEFGMTKEDALKRKAICLSNAEKRGLINYAELQKARMINDSNQTVCPLCLEKLSSYGFFNRLVQAIGREVHDLTVTEINLFHIKELRYGQYNHRPYNLGWGHHHCNVVVKDSGIDETLHWMNGVLIRNKNSKLFEEPETAI